MSGYGVTSEDVGRPVVPVGSRVGRIATRYDKLAANDLASVKLASISICLREAA
jgi:transposase